MGASLTHPRMMSAQARAAWLLTLGAFAALGGAWFFQFVVNLPPCPLCYQQRIPYWIAMALGIAALVVPGRLGAVLVGAGVISVMVSGGIGVYHAGIEYGFWPGPQTCSGMDLNAAPDSIAAMQAMLNSDQAVVTCDKPAWTLFGISLAGFNVLYAAVLASAAATLWMARSGNPQSREKELQA